MLLCLLSVGFSARGDSEVLFKYAEYAFSETFTIPTEASGKEKALSANTGLKILFRDVDLRAYVTLPKTEFAELSTAESLSQKTDLLTDVRYGAGILLLQNYVPISLKLGRNTFSKSVSKLKNPSPSTTANPLATSFAFTPGIGARLPTLTSSVQSRSLALSLSPKAKKTQSQFLAETFITEEKNGVASVSVKHQFLRAIFVQSAVSLGRFYIENNTTILQKNNAAFNAGWFYSALAETAVHTPLLKLNFYTGIQQSPYDSNPVWIKAEGRTTLSFLQCTATYFSIINAKDSPKAAPLIGGSSTICRVSEQASVNPQMLFLLNDRHASSVRFGFSALEQQKITATNTPVLLTTLKLRAGAAYENHFFTTRFDWTHANILLDGDPPTKSSTPEECHSFSLSSSYAGKHAKVSLSGSYARYPPLTETSALKEVYSADVKIGVPALKISAQAGVDVTLKDGERSAGEFDARITYTMKRKYLHTSLKVGLAMPF